MVSQNKWSDIYGADQVLTTSKFVVEFFNIPSSIVDTNKLKLYCKSSQLPDKETEMADTRIGSFPITQPDGIGPAQDWTLEIIENSRAEMLPMLFDWKEMSMGSESGNSTRGYNQAKAIQTMYNLYGEPASRMEIFNCYPVVIPSPKPDSSTSGSVVEYSCTFKISRWRPMGSVFK